METLQNSQYRTENHENPEEHSPNLSSLPAPNSQKDLSQILAQNTNEARLPVKDLVDILDKAWLLTQAEKTAPERHKAITAEIGEKPEDTLPLSYLYHRAESLGIPIEQVEKVRKIYYPTDEEQLKQLKSLNAKPTKNLLADKYAKEILNSLQRTFPSDIFCRSEWGGNYFCRIRKEEIEKRFLFWKWKKINKENETLAYFDYSSPPSLRIYHKDFTLATQAKLQELQEKFHFIKEIKYDYPVGNLK